MTQPAPSPSMASSFRPSASATIPTDTIASLPGIPTPGTGQLLVQISWHRDTRKLGVILHGDRRWSFEGVDEMRELGINGLA